MKLCVSIATAVALLSNDATVQAFTPQNTRAIRYTATNASPSSQMHLSMTAEAEAETEMLELSDYASINALTYRQLQQQCKERSLQATGNTAALRCRLLEDLGLIKDGEECEITEDEVRLNY